MRLYLLSLLILGTQALRAVSPTPLAQYIDYLGNLRDADINAHYEVLLPQAEDPVSYDIHLQSTVADGDNLSPCRYLITWTHGQESEDDTVNGFTAYFDGSHYRYRDGRLQEYHYTWDSIPFIMRGGGVQGSAQFTDVLPQFLGHELRKLVADSNFTYTFTPDTLYNGRHVAVLAGKTSYHGYVSKESTYILDPSSLMPIAIEHENNPGSISEQSVSITYGPLHTAPFPLTGENDLMAMYPELFEKYRESNFRIENLPGTLLPTFTARIPAGSDRYVYHRGTPLTQPQVIILIDEAGANTTATVQAVRQAARMSPSPFDILTIFVTSPDAELINSLIGPATAGETILTGARALARDCGVNSYPTIIYVDRLGKVADVTLGYNKDLSNVVIQTATLRAH